MKLSKLDWAVIGLILAALVALLVPAVQEEVWDGHFLLTIAVNESEPIDRESLLFATCWNESDARAVLDNPGVYEGGFRPPEFTQEGSAVIAVPTSGRTGPWGMWHTYNQPEFLVVEYQLATGDNPTRVRKRFTIPTGRGPRSMVIQLP